MHEKRCIDCKHVKPLIEFYKNKRTSHYMSYCKDCTKARVIANYHERKQEQTALDVRPANQVGKDRSPLYMNSQQLLNSYGVTINGVRKVPSETVQQLLAGVYDIKIL